MPPSPITLSGIAHHTARRPPTPSVTALTQAFATPLSTPVAYPPSPGGGYSFYKDAKLRRITRYRYNNVPGDNGARNYYITRMNEDGTPELTWSPTFLPAKTPLDVYRCRHGIGYTVFEAERVGVAGTLTAFVPLPTGDVTTVSVEATF